MTTFTISPLRVILLSILGATIVFGAVFMAITFLWQPRDFLMFEPVTEDRLPSQAKEFLRVFPVNEKHTLFFATHASGAVLRISMSGATVRTISDALFPRLSPAADYSIATDDASSIWEEYASTLEDHERDAFIGYVSARTGERLGDVSFTYDILPAITGPTLFSWRTGTGSQTSFIMQTSAATASEARRTLSSMHERIKESMQSVTVTRRTLPNDVESAILKSEPGHVEDTESTQNGWAVRETRQKDGGRLLVSGIRGKRVIVSTNREWFDQALEDDVSVSTGEHSLDVLFQPR